MLLILIINNYFYEMRKLLSILLILVVLSISNAQSMKELKENFKKSETVQERGEFALEIANLYDSGYKKSDSMLVYLNVAKELLDVESNTINSGFYYHLKSKASFLKADYTESISFGEKSIRIYDDLDMKYKSALSKSKVGLSHQALKNNSKAIIFLKDAEFVLKGKDLVPTLVGLATSYLQLNALDKSIIYYKRAEDLSQIIKYDSYLGVIYTGLASAYSNYGNADDKFIAYNKKSLKIYKDKKYYVGMAMTLNNLGIHFLNTNNLNEA